MRISMDKHMCVLLMCVLVESAASFGSASTPSVCPRDFNSFLYDLNSQCPFSNPFSSPPTQVDGDSLEKAVNSSQKNEYTAILFYASWCPFSSTYLSKFTTLSAMYPYIKHVMVEQSSAMPSVFSRYGIHSVPALLMVNQTSRVRYHGQKDLQSLVNFYKRATGLHPLINLVEETETPKDSAGGSHVLKLWDGASLKVTFAKEPYLLLSVMFVILRAFLYLFPEILSRLMALWMAYIPRLNLSIFGESRQVLGHVLHLIDVKRIWSKLKICKTRNFHQGARNAGVWASSLSSVSLGKALSSSSSSSSTRGL
ncbi:5'-adenylylsulfate reductase-like 5 [Andrographis paniculata]|uniref:5'-adenylylsulfate reductase-like 5 n=1 Tax=Andrographis paniculata TaxID=175694 RepID=UPI0021E7F73A|nr:5'-adenylylsulfate reductase-like 5 [Andrographis paniculata]